MFLEKIVCGVLLFLLLSCNELDQNKNKKKCKRECDVNSILLYQFSGTFTCTKPPSTQSSQIDSVNNQQYETCLRSTRNSISRFISQYASDCKKKCE
jgi:hypothetical protein